MPQETPPPLPVLDYGRPPRGARWRRIVECVAAVSAAAIMFLLQPRLISLVLLGILIAPCLLDVALGGARRGLAMFRRKGYPIVVALVVSASLFLPFDVALGSFYFGERYGTSPGGPHFVRFSVGMPRHALLRKAYGEYINCGCVSPAAIPPRWVWVWD